jgi:hypothetical protein
MKTRIALTALNLAFLVAICCMLAGTSVRAEGNSRGSHRPTIFKAALFQKGAKQSSAWTKPHDMLGAGRGSVKAVNAIGLAVPGIEVKKFEHPNATSHQNTIMTGRGIQDNGALGSRMEGNFHAPSNPPNKLGSAPASTAGVNGTTISHIASGPAHVGGAAHNISGINGTTVRPKF